MMRVQMVTLLAGPDGVSRPGDVLQVDDALAAQWIEAGYAVQVGGPAPHMQAVETAVAEPVAEKRTPKRKAQA